MMPIISHVIWSLWYRDVQLPTSHGRKHELIKMRTNMSEKK
jgi:hypothetical protein